MISIVSAFLAKELEDVYERTETHRTLTFQDFVELVVDKGLEQYRKEKTLESVEDPPESEPLHLVRPGGTA